MNAKTLNTVDNTPKKTKPKQNTRSLTHGTFYVVLS